MLVHFSGDLVSGSQVHGKCFLLLHAFPPGALPAHFLTSSAPLLSFTHSLEAYLVPRLTAPKQLHAVRHKFL